MVLLIFVTKYFVMPTFEQVLYLGSGEKQLIALLLLKVPYWVQIPNKTEMLTFLFFLVLLLRIFHLSLMLSSK